MNLAAALDIARIPSFGWMLGAPLDKTASLPPLRQTWMIRHGETLVVDEPLGQAVICTEGALWITHDPGAEVSGAERGHPRTGTRPARMLVHALSDATVQFVPV